ncbi:MAG: hypothetical protein IJA10_11535 [Lachnospiraceae bacterium]|nr:hypothetical protein [Lachnospiraceae bacterium]
MSNYLIKHYKGKYRLKAPIDLSTNTFSRNFNGGFEDIDVYVDCKNNIQIYYYGRSILEVYIPSLGRGHNIIKAINEEFIENIIFDIKETSEEVMFKFKASDMNKLEKYLKPKTNGANISPFSVKNIKSSKYVIPNEELNTYKKLIENIPKNQLITIAHTTNSFLQSLATKKNPYENIKADMALKGLKNKEYIHSIGKWEEYIDYLKMNIY